MKPASYGGNRFSLRELTRRSLRLPFVYTLPLSTPTYREATLKSSWFLLASDSRAGDSRAPYGHGEVLLCNWEIPTLKED